jgi:hypothetical protein
MNISNIELVEVPNTRWTVTLSKLYDLSPDTAEEVIGLPDGVTIWDTHFVEDLFQAEDSTSNHLLDIGWYPGGEADGHFRLVLITKDAGESEYNWRQPVFQYETRSVDQLVTKLKNIMSAKDLSDVARDQ